MQFLTMDTFEKAGRWLMAWFCQLIYTAITWVFDLFMNITKINILEAEDIQPIYQRITMILTIVMVFYVTFEFVKYVVQPDAMTDKEKGAGNIVYKIFAVILLLAFVPKIFGWAYTIQGKILETRVIEKVILGGYTIDGKSMGSNFSANIFGMFYQADTEFTDGENGVYEGIVSENLRTLRDESSLSNITAGLYETGTIKTSYEEPYDEIEKPRINFQGIFAVLVGGFILYILVLYCIDVGTRWAQMLFLQIIAPISIIGYLAPKKDGMFQKWTKQCLTTYLDLFLRLAIIYFILLVCEILTHSYGTKELFSGLGDVGTTMEIFIYIVLVMGLLVFARKAPKMLSELFPKGGAASGNFGLSAKDRGLKGASRVFGAAAGGAVGAVVGAGAGLAQGWRGRKSLNKDGKAKGVGAGIWGATKGAVGGVVGGAVRGIANGSKKGNMIKNVSAGAKNQIKASQRFGNREENGYGFMDQMGDRVKGAVGARSRVEMQEDAKAPIKRQANILGEIFKSNKAQRDEAKKHAIQEGKSKYSAYYKAAAQEVYDLKENENAKKRFKVSQFANQAEADKAYEDAVHMAKASVNKNNFYDANGNFDQAGYDKACDIAKKGIDKSQYEVGYASQADAQAAYVAEVESKFNKSAYCDANGNITDQAGYNAAFQAAAAANNISQDNFKVTYSSQANAQAAYVAEVESKFNKSAYCDANGNITDQAGYNAAFQAAAQANNIDRNDYQVIYMTQAEADEDYNLALAAADRALDEAEKTAINDYLDNGEWDGTKYVDPGKVDQVVINERKQLAARIEEYNKTASSDRKNDKIEIDNNGHIYINGVQKTAAEFHKYAKACGTEKSEKETEIIRIDEEIERIKRQTSGSGINEGKK